MRTTLELPEKPAQRIRMRAAVLVVDTNIVASLLIEGDRTRDVQASLRRALFCSRERSVLGDGRRAPARCRTPLGVFGDIKPVGEGVLELREDIGPGYRVYIGRYGARLVILLCGGDKGSQDADIKRTREYWWDWKRRST